MRDPEGATPLERQQQGMPSIHSLGEEELAATTYTPEQHQKNLREWNDWANDRFTKAWSKMRNKLIEEAANLIRDDAYGNPFGITPEGLILFMEPQMTSEQAYTTIKTLRQNGKKKFSDEEKRALEYAMVMIAQKVGEEVLSGEREYTDAATMHIPVSEKSRG